MFYCRVNNASSNSFYNYGLTILVNERETTILRDNIWWVIVQSRDHQVMRISAEDPHILEHNGFEPLCLYRLLCKLHKLHTGSIMTIWPELACRHLYLMYLHVFISTSENLQLIIPMLIVFIQNKYLTTSSIVKKRDLNSILLHKNKNAYWVNGSNVSYFPNKKK